MTKKSEEKLEIDKIYSDPAKFKARALEEIRRARRYATFVSLVAIDLAHVDSNDEIEHFNSFDDFMQSLMKLIRVSIRETDLISGANRHTVLILLTDTPHEGASALSERLKKTLRYFMCNNIKSPLNWRVPIKEYYFPSAQEDDLNIITFLEKIGP